jgi:pyruvate/2-oxoglutarate dehydrogenase complex dihydrolipoamide acyltransferase (E2) component
MEGWMIYKLDVPELSEDAGEVRVLEWHGQAGDAFEPGAMIIELETHKAIVEIRAGQPTVLRKINVAAGEWCVSGAPLGLCSDGADEELPADETGVGPLLARFEIA